MRKQSAVWDGKDMAAIQILLHDVRQRGVPAAQWYIRREGVPVLHVRMFPDGPLHLVPPGATVMRFGDDAHLAVAMERPPPDLSGHPDQNS